MFSNRIYDILKWIALVVLPAVGTLYFSLAQIWGFPYGEQIVLKPIDYVTDLYGYPFGY